MRLTKVVQERRLTAFSGLADTLAWALEAVPDSVGIRRPPRPSWFTTKFLGTLAPSDAAAIVVYASGESVRGWTQTVRVNHTAGDN